MSNSHLPSDLSRWSAPNARGNCLCFPANPECEKALAKFGLKGIVYRNGEPQFSACSIETIEIPMMTHERNNTESFRTKEERKISHKKDTYEGMTAEQVAAKVVSQASSDYATVGNFDQADALLAQKWTEENRDNHAWTAKMVEKYRTEHGLTWHERQDMKTMDLVPTVIHNDFAHLGGTGILKERYRITAEINEEYAADEGAYNDFSDEEYDYYLQKAAEAEKTDENVSNSAGFAPLHIIITVGMIIGFVVTYLVSDTNDFLGKILWFLTVIGPYAALAALCMRFNGLPNFLRNRTGGIALLVILTVLLVLVPFLSTVLFIVYLAFGIIAFFRGAGAITSAFAPTGRITVRREDADGNITIQEKDVYGDMNDAIRSTENELRNEGYDNITHD